MPAYDLRVEKQHFGAQRPVVLVNETTIRTFDAVKALIRTWRTYSLEADGTRLVGQTVTTDQGVSPWVAYRAVWLDSQGYSYRITVTEVD